MKVVLGINSVSKVKLLCSESALALVGAVGRNRNIHLLVCGSRDFCFTCIWSSRFPFGFEFCLDAEFMQEVTASIKSASQVQKGLIQDEHRTVLENKPWAVQHLQQEN